LQTFNAFWAQAVSIAWGLPLVILLLSAGIYFTIASRFAPFFALRHTYHILRGRYDDPKDPGQINHFQALTSALSATIGMGNIAGVAVAITTGGPGAIFWMWVAGAVGMATKFFTCTLACMYRKEDEDGIEQGGPMYFIEVGLGKHFKPLAMMFAFCGMFGCLAIFQSNQLATLLDQHWQIEPLATGFVSMFIVGAVILGSITRVGAVSSAVVPSMCLLYIASCVYIIGSQIEQVPELFSSIFVAAFGGEAVIGGAVGLSVKEIIITGFKRAAFSNEAGIGTAAMAHGAAKTSEPVREGLVAMIGPFIDTHIVCTMTALVILSSGVNGGGNGVVMTANAFESAMPGLGTVILTLIFCLFAVSTMISYSYYSLKCSRYLFGKRVGSQFIYVYLALIPLAAVWSQSTIINIIDTAFAMMAIPTLVSSLLLSPKVMAASRAYFKKI